MLKHSLLASVSIVAFLTLAASARADLAGSAFTIRAESGGDVGTYEVGLDAGSFDSQGNYHWTLDAPTAITGANGAELAWLGEANLTIIQDPVVTLNFVVSSGSATNFTVTSANLSFPTIPLTGARASAAITVTDFSGNGATLSGLHAGGKAYQAFYNDAGSVPATGTIFDSLVDGTLAGAFASSASSEDSPGPSGFTSIGAVSSMSSQFKFSTGAGDSASGTSVFVTQAIPEPSAFLYGGIISALAGCGFWVKRRLV